MQNHRIQKSKLGHESGKLLKVFSSNFGFNSMFRLLWF